MWARPRSLRVARWTDLEGSAKFSDAIDTQRVAVSILWKISTATIRAFSDGPPVHKCIECMNACSDGDAPSQCLQASFREGPSRRGRSESSSLIAASTGLGSSWARADFGKFASPREHKLLENCFAHFSKKSPKFSSLQRRLKDHTDSPRRAFVELAAQ